MSACLCGCGGTPSSRAEGFVHGHHRRRHPHGYEILDNGCWQWRGNVSHDGYALIWRSDKRFNEHASRAFYREAVGEIPDGMVLDHLCRNRRCVNPKHLEPVTNAENSRRGVAARGTSAAAPLLTVEEAAPLTRHSVSSLYKLARKGFPGAHKIGGRILFCFEEMLAGSVIVRPDQLPARSGAKRDRLLQIVSENH